MNLSSFDYQVGMDTLIAELGLFGDTTGDFYLLRVRRKVMGSALRYPSQNRGGSGPKE